MAIKTQGTNLYTIDPDDGTLITVGCVTSIDGIDTSIDQIETTCLGDSARSYLAGLASPGAASFGINIDPSDESHVRLHQLKVAGEVLNWALGWSDGTAAPTVATNSDGSYEFTLPATRSWLDFEGFMNSFPFSFAQNAVVQSSVGIQISGEPVLVPKT